jgi:dipeptidyl aminopeptidase/acylaminoacyl peptidase
MWSDLFEGKAKPSNHFPESKVDKLQGKLLLMNGMTDICTPPAAVFRIVEALQKANKDFDMVLLPNLGHDPSRYNFRRGWDYFVQHLLGEEPPKGFLVSFSWDME